MPGGSIGVIEVIGTEGVIGDAGYNGDAGIIETEVV